MSDTTSLRLTALDLANKPEFQAKSTEQVVQRANAYLDFLTGDEQSTQQPPAEAHEVLGMTSAPQIHRNGYNQALKDVLSLRDKLRLNEDDEVLVRDATKVIRGLWKN